MGITIRRDHRNAIYGELLVDLTGTGEIYTHIQNGDYEAAQSTRRRYEENMRLLDDLGWGPEGDDDEYEITMDAGDLTHALRRLNLNAGETIHRHVIEPIESEFTVRAVHAQTAYGDIFAQLSGTDDDEPEQGR